ncbi:ubiquitin-related domain-containing protein, partial [Dimargaris cristalligena]
TTEHINIKVVSSDAAEVHFKIRRSTVLRKLMETYCDRTGKSMNSIRFLFEGERVLPTHTPQELEMDDGDTIDVMVQQVGG